MRGWRHTIELKLALTLRLVAGHFLLIFIVGLNRSLDRLGRLLLRYWSDKALTDEDVLSEAVQVVECRTVDPDLLKAQTGIKLDFIVPSSVTGRESSRMQQQ